MPFDYYRRLGAKQRRTYRRSDAIDSVPLAPSDELVACSRRLEQALGQESRAGVTRAANGLVGHITNALGVSAVKVRVLARRPRETDGELHGLYTLEQDGRAHIEVWMRTAEQERVVAFRTFLRTLLHEVCHHLDLTLLGLEDTFHTEGFFKRESSLVRVLAPAKGARPAPGAARRGEQLSLFD